MVELIDRVGAQLTSTQKVALGEVAKGLRIRLSVLYSTAEEILLEDNVPDKRGLNLMRDQALLNASRLPITLGAEAGFWGPDQGIDASGIDHRLDPQAFLTAAAKGNFVAMWDLASRVQVFKAGKFLTLEKALIA